jgi:hypothetical protein
MAEAHNSLGNAVCVQGELDEAIACYRRALGLKPDYVEAHSNLAIALQGQGQLDEAITCCRRAIALQPNYVRAYNNLGDACLAQGKFELAIDAYRHAVRLSANVGLVQDALDAHTPSLDLNSGYSYAIRFVSTRELAADRRAAELDITGQEEHDCRLVSSRGILKSCDVHPRHPTTVRAFPHAEYPPDWIDNLRPGQSLYVCTSAMSDFVANVFPRLASSGRPFVLVTGDADELAPVDLFPSAAAAAQFLDSPHLLAWFAQNCVVQHPKLVPLPIGLDYHTITIGGVPWWGPKMTPAQQEAELLAIRHAPAAVRPPHRAYANFHFSLNKRFGSDRRAALAQIPLDSVDYEPRNTPRVQSWKKQRLEHRFVLSPAGTGLDCHRTWEALCLGCIPIVRTSPLDGLWEGLDVWIVNSWSEVNADSMATKAAELDACAAAARRNTEIPAKLLLKTWVDEIRRAGAKAD